MQADRTQRTQEKENERSVRKNAVCYPVSTDFALKKNFAFIAHKNVTTPELRKK